MQQFSETNLAINRKPASPARHSSNDADAIDPSHWPLQPCFSHSLKKENYTVMYWMLRKCASADWIKMT
jgi:hypothetical protein